MVGLQSTNSRHFIDCMHARGRFRHRLDVAVRRYSCLISAGVFAQLSFRNSFQLNEWSDLRVSCRPPSLFCEQ